MKRLLFFALLFSLKSYAGDTTRLLYRPYADAAREVEALLQRARAENKRLLIQVGGNWCLMCYRLNSSLQTDTALKSLLDRDYLLYHLNYSRENKNLALLNKWGGPQRFGFPVLVVLEATGRRLHTQNCALLLKGNGYDPAKLRSFLLAWKPQENAQYEVGSTK
ncbi:thioredoxin family protein [Paraflavisolibacter sp. H34]|uniref:thioredoxin family protein n=1 Tax=Huijunlia imazamoxiresistens TaxID=3127457 RepID=UPI00301A84DE